MYHCIPFLNLQNIYFIESLSKTISDSHASVLCNDLCYVMLRACRNCWKNLWIYSPNAFVKDIQIKRINCHYKGFIFNAFSFYIGKVFSITCACSFVEALIICHNISERKLFHLNLSTLKFTLFLKEGVCGVIYAEVFV